MFSVRRALVVGLLTLLTAGFLSTGTANAAIPPSLPWTLEATPPPAGSSVLHVKFQAQEPIGGSEFFLTTQVFTAKKKLVYTNTEFPFIPVGGSWEGSYRIDHLGKGEFVIKQSVKSGDGRRLEPSPHVTPFKH